MKEIIKTILETILLFIGIAAFGVMEWELHGSRLVTLFIAFTVIGLGLTNLIDYMRNR